MPFTKLPNGKYRGPTGRVFNYKQVQMYYANGGKFPGQKKGGKRARRRGRSKK